MQMSRKKKNKFCITVGFACNADCSEKLPIFYIGKSKQPHCFKKITPNACGFYYQNNKTAWMTSEFFEEWIKALNIQMQHENQHICMLINNFSGHNINYEPHNNDLR